MSRTRTRRIQQRILKRVWFAGAPLSLLSPAHWWQLSTKAKAWSSTKNTVRWVLPPWWRPSFRFFCIFRAWWALNVIMRADVLRLPQSPAQNNGCHNSSVRVVGAAQRPCQQDWCAAQCLRLWKLDFTPVNSGYNTLQIIEQCEKAVSKLTAHALVNGNYRHKFEKGDLSRTKLVFLEVITMNCLYLLDLLMLIMFFSKRIFLSLCDKIPLCRWSSVGLA